MNRHLRRGLIASLVVILFAAGVVTGLAQTAPIPTETFVETDHSPSPAGLAVTLTAVVQTFLPNAGTPTGTVEFFSGTTRLGSAALAQVDGEMVATLVVQLPAGIHPIIARYPGNSDYLFSISAPPIAHEVLN